MELGLHLGRQGLAIPGPRKGKHFPQPKVMLDSKEASRKDLLNPGGGPRGKWDFHTWGFDNRRGCQLL